MKKLKIEKIKLRINIAILQSIKLLIYKHLNVKLKKLFFICFSVIFANSNLSKKYTSLLYSFIL